jgi:hypothetical protein
MSAIRRIQNLKNYAGYVTMTAVGVGVTAMLFLPTAQTAIEKSKNIDTIFVAAGGLIGTILALVFSLSIIPIQRAAETYTPSLIWLYGKDTKTQGIFFALATFSFISFIFAIEGIIPIPITIRLPLQILLLAVALDLLRWHHRLVIALLQPAEAIHRLLRVIVRRIDQTQRLVARRAQLQWRTLSAEQQAEHAPELIETAIYTQANYHASVNNWTSELAETVRKAIARGETYTAQLAITALGSIACHYLGVRKNNLILIPSPEALFMASESDTRKVLTPIYEHLKDINRHAVTLRAETSTAHVIESFAQIAAYTAQLNARAFRYNSAPLTATPTFYLQKCAEEAQKNNLDDAGLRASELLSWISQSAKENVPVTDIHIPILDSLYEIAMIFLAQRKGTITNLVLDRMMSIPHLLLRQNYFQLNDVLRHLLGQFEQLIFLGRTTVPIIEMPGTTPPLASPYDLTKQASIGYLIAESTKLVKIDEERWWVNPYTRFMSLNEITHHHFRELAEKVDFGSSFLLWHITQTIKHITDVYLDLLQNPVADNKDHIDKLVDQIPWYLAFFWVTFSKTTTFSYQRAEEACDILSRIGLAYYNAGFPEVTETSVSNITSIVTSYCEKTQNINPYHAANLLMRIWYIRVFADAQGDADREATIVAKMDKPDTITADRWLEVERALEIRKAQLEEDLGEIQSIDSFRASFHAAGLLKLLLARNTST